MWGLCVEKLQGELCGETEWGQLCGGIVWVGAVWESCIRELWGAKCMWSCVKELGELCVGTCVGAAPAPCPHPQQQPGSPLQCVPTSPTACSIACAPSSSLFHYSPTQGRVRPCEWYVCGPLSACISCAFSVYLCSRPLV